MKSRLDLSLQTMQNNKDQPCAENLQSTSFKKLNDAVEKSIKRITSKSRGKAYLEEHFKDVLEKDRKYFVPMFESMLVELETLLKEEIQMQLEASNVEKRLKEVDRIKLEYGPSSETKWRPSGSPKDDIKAHLVDIDDVELNKLGKILNTLESQNKFLSECVLKTDEKLQQTVQVIKEYCSSWEEAASEISQETRSKLTKNA
uniref:Uncharacterized protein n=2 Tax=Biomphalaria glabrata TaxID=6526 RepID=A0A2C9M8D7_BIOGL